MSEPRESQFTEEELRTFEAELARLTVDDVLLQTVVTLINLGARKAGLLAKTSEQGGSGVGQDAGTVTEDADGSSDKPDFNQLRMAIEGARALIPLLETRYHDELAPIRESLSRLQMVYASHVGPGDQEKTSDRISATGNAGTTDKVPGSAKTGTNGPEKGPAQQSGRLWVPGQK